jgi:hypothetical protein
MLRDGNSSRFHEREAVFHHAAVSAQEETAALAARIEGPIAAVKGTRRAREDAEDATANAMAARQVAAIKLDGAVRAIAAEAEAADRQRPTAGLLLRLFPGRTAAEMGALALGEQLREAAKLGERVGSLPEGDPLRERLAALTATAAALEAKRAAYGAALQAAAAARVREEVAQLDLRRTMGANRGTLIEMNHGDARAAAVYFRMEPRRKPNGNGAPVVEPQSAPEPSPPAAQ